MNVKLHHPAELAPAVVVHSLADAQAALAPGRSVTLLSATGAACFAGAGWWRALTSAARRDFPATAVQDVLDCGDAAGVALEALRGGQRLIRLAPGPAWRLVAARALAGGAMVLAERPAALDLAPRGARRRLPAWLEGGRDSGDGLG